MRGRWPGALYEILTPRAGDRLGEWTCRGAGERESRRVAGDDLDKQMGREILDPGC